MANSGCRSASPGLAFVAALACAACDTSVRQSSNGSGGALFSSGGLSVSAGGFSGSGGKLGSGGAFGSAGTLTAGGGGAFGSAGASGVGGTKTLHDGGPLEDASDMDRDGDSSRDEGSNDGSMVIGVPIPAPRPIGCVTDVTPGVHTFPCDTAIDVVTIPAQCTKTACGVIVDVHGGMMSSQMEDKNTNMSALGLKHGYIVIQPNALQNPILLNQRLFVAGTDDTRVMDILTQVMTAFHVDQDRIHMTGFSEGGYMTWRWFCQHSDLLASIAPGAAGWKCANLANLGLTPPEVACEFSTVDGGGGVPARNIPVLYMQGMKDGLVDPTCADKWIRSNVLPTLKVDQGRQIAGDSTFTRTRFLDPTGVPFEYIQHQYSTDSSFLGVGIVGHCYPGSTDLTVTPPAQTVIPPDQLMAFGCKDACSFTWGEEVMKFFIDHPRRP